MTTHRLSIGTPNHDIAIFTPAPVTTDQFAALGKQPDEKMIAAYAETNVEGSVYEAGSTTFSVLRGERAVTYALTWSLARRGDPASMARDVTAAFLMLRAAAGLGDGQGLRGHTYVEFEGAMWEENAMLAEQQRRTEEVRKEKEAQNEKMRAAAAQKADA